MLFEPAPYELSLVGLIVGWVRQRPQDQPLYAAAVVLLMLYITGGMIALAMIDIVRAGTLVYIGTSALLDASAMFFAAVIVVDPERRIDVIIRGLYRRRRSVPRSSASSAISPRSELFTLYDRARGTFQDPNVLRAVPDPALLLSRLHDLHAAAAPVLLAGRRRLHHADRHLPHLLARRLGHGGLRHAVRGDCGASSISAAARHGAARIVVYARRSVVVMAVALGVIAVATRHVEPFRRACPAGAEL